jgi:glycosyltransferase involved in cell wall biosynthesis
MGGLDVMTQRLIPALRTEAPHVRLSVFVNAAGRAHLGAQPWAQDVDLVTHPLLGRRGLRAASELTVLGTLAARRGCDVVHSLALTAPVRPPMASVVTLADVTWIVAPDANASATMTLWRLVVPPVARRADRVIAISRAGARDVVKHLRVRADRVDVVYPGFEPQGGVVPTPEGELRARLGLPSGRLVMTVGHKRPHKNFLRLVRAMALVRERVPDAVLALPGNPTPYEHALRVEAARLGLDGAVAFPGFVDAADLEGLYATARCFAFPSLNEGFGLPVLDAQARGVPVACSRAASLPEAGGPGARYFDPLDERDMAEAITAVLTDRGLAQRLVAAGRAHQAAFTWERSAQGTLATYERALAARAILR